MVARCYYFCLCLIVGLSPSGCTSRHNERGRRGQVPPLQVHRAISRPFSVLCVDSIRQAAQAHEAASPERHLGPRGAHSLAQDLLVMEYMFQELLHIVRGVERLVVMVSEPREQSRE